MLIKTKNISKNYQLGKVIVPALLNIDLSIAKGEFLSIVGPSGSGKTTLLNILGCLDTATTGSLYFKDRNITELSRSETTLLRRHAFGFIFQTFNLISVLTAFENIELPLFFTKHNKSKRKQLVESWLEKVGIQDFKSHRPDELSGGQRQRVSIARALISHPQVVLADEPTANLDQKTGRSIMDLMHKMNQDLHTTFIFSTHDPNVMERASRKIVLEDGSIKSEASA